MNEWSNERATEKIEQTKEQANEEGMDVQGFMSLFPSVPHNTTSLGVNMKKHLVFCFVETWIQSLAWRQPVITS